MDSEERKKYIADQIKEIEKFKWIESEKSGRDIGRNEAAKRWIEKYAKSFSEWWAKRKEQDAVKDADY